MNDTTILYNGITVSLVQIVAHAMTPIYDESGIVQTANRRSITFTGIVHNLNVADFVSDATTVQRKLMEPRQTLNVKFGATDYINVTPTGGNQTTSDIDNGPKPRNIEVTPFYAGVTCMVTGTFEWTEYGNYGPSGIVQAVVVSHRWEQAFSIDRNNYSVRTVNGTMILSTKAAVGATTNPDAYREYIYPPYILGFKRERADFVISSDAKTIRYTIVDREEYRPYPGLAQDGSGSYSVKAIGSNLVKTFSISLSGSKNTYPGALVNAAYTALTKKINIASTISGGDIITSVELEEDLFSNSITLSAQALVKNGLVGSASLGQSENFFVPLEDARPSPQVAGQFTQPTPYGSAIVRAVAQAIFDSAVDGNPANAAAMTKATVEGVDAGSLTTPNTITVTQQSGTGIDNPHPITGDPIAASTDQNTSSMYVGVVQGFKTEINNNLCAIDVADPTYGTVIQQVGPPRVIEKRWGSVSRMNSPPSLGAIQSVAATSGSSRRGMIRNMNIELQEPEIAANTSANRYTATFSYDVIIPYDPDSAEWDDSYNVVGSQNATVFMPSSSMAYPINPSVQPQFIENQTIPTNYRI